MPTTNKQVLDLILKKVDDLAETQKELAKMQLQSAADFSNFMNKQIITNKEWMGYLESNNKTNQKGLVEQVKENTNDIASLKTDKKVTAGKIGLAGIIFTTLGAFILKLMGVIKIFI